MGDRIVRTALRLEEVSKGISRYLVIACFFVATARGAEPEIGAAPPAPQVSSDSGESRAEIRQIAELEERDIRESSGIAVSHQHPGLLWTHNDSGGKPRLYAFDLEGKHRGTCKFLGVACDDWEDMGTFSEHGQNYLFVADTGDNGHNRDHYSIFWGLEPSKPTGDTTGHELVFRYEDGAHDCEAVAYDVVRHVFVLVEKRLGLTSRVYSFPWDGTGSRNAAPFVAKQIGAVPVAMATGADISADGRRFAIATYVSGYELVCDPAVDWKTAMEQGGTHVSLPKRRQGESICYGWDGVTLYLTSEKRPCPLFSITRPVGENAASRAADGQAK